MEVIVLAGGFGTRLRDVIGDEIPKPMAPVNGKPFLSFLLEWLTNYNVEKIILSVGYKSEVIKSFFGSSYKNIPIIYCEEHQPLGTGGAVLLAMQETSGDNVLVVNGDTWFPIDLASFSNFHLSSSAQFSIALKRMTNFSRYGTVDLDGNTVRQFNEKKQRDEGLINGGIYLIDKGYFLSVELPERFSLETDFLNVRVMTGRIKGMVCDKPFVDIGVPDDYSRAAGLIRINKALFLDRDGVINVDKVHVCKVEDFEFMPGIFELAESYQQQGFLIIVVTNQAGIAKKLYTENDFLKLTDWMIQQFADHGVTITKVYYCPHHPDFTGECECRKPAPGMLLRAIEEYNIDPQSSVLIGDKDTDLMAGKNAGIGTLLMV